MLPSDERIYSVQISPTMFGLLVVLAVCFFPVIPGDSWTPSNSWDLHADPQIGQEGP